jgi:hypothetical protein
MTGSLNALFATQRSQGAFARKLLATSKINSIWTHT